MPQDHKLAFLNAAIDRRTTSEGRVQPSATPYILQAGAVIPASLIRLALRFAGASHGAGNGKRL
jgi:type IV secretory pathway VirB10-like protein